MANATDLFHSWTLNELADETYTTVSVSQDIITIKIDEDLMPEVLRDTMHIDKVLFEGKSVEEAIAFLEGFYYVIMFYKHEYGEEK